MGEWMPENQFLKADFQNDLRDISNAISSALSLEELDRAFHCAISLHGGMAHACFILKDDQATFLFGESILERIDQNKRHKLQFTIAGWDGNAYRLDLLLRSGLPARDTRAQLHALSALYVCRGTALFEADHIAARDQPGESETVDFPSETSSLIDIADKAKSSVHAIQIRLERAQR
jgi:hypothetical protein